VTFFLTDGKMIGRKMKDPVMALASVATTVATIICQGHLDREDMPALKARLVLVVKRVSPDVMD
jgi:hypothetical protein